MGNYIKVQILLLNSLKILFQNIMFMIYGEPFVQELQKKAFQVKIKKLEYIQGHTIGVMLEFYNVYSKRKENDKEIIIGI